MAQHILVEIEMPGDLETFSLPTGLHQRLQQLLDQQDAGHALSDAEHLEAEGLVQLSEMLSLLRLRARRIWGER